MPTAGIPVLISLSTGITSLIVSIASSSFADLKIIEVPLCYKKVSREAYF